MSDQVPIPLAYAQRPCRRRRVAIILLVLASLIATGWIIREPILRHYHQARYLHFEQRPLLQFSAPPGTIAVATDGDLAAALFAADSTNYHLSGWLDIHVDPPPKDWKPMAIYLPAPFQRLGFRKPTRQDGGDALLFSHLRTPSNEIPLLVIVTAKRWRTDYDEEGLHLTATTFLPATRTPGSRPRVVVRQEFDVLTGDPEFNLRLHVGSPDPSDPSRFSVPFSTLDQPGLIEFQLTDDYSHDQWARPTGPVRITRTTGPFKFIEYDSVANIRSFPRRR